MMKFIKIITLLALTALFAGCNMFNEPEMPVLSNSELAQVRVTIGGNARTILPDIGAGFSKYVLSAAPGTGNTQTAPAPVEISDTEYNESRYIAIDLSYGNWIFTATAYVKVNGVDYAAANGSTSLDVDDIWHSIAIAINAPETGGTGTFSYTVAYPSAGTASLSLAPIGNTATPVINVTSVTNGVTASESVASGVYFLTVSAVKNGTTVTRNEVVHIYPQLTTSANYTFTKLDLGDDYLQLGGTVNILVDGKQPEYAYIYVYPDQHNWETYFSINFSNDNNAVDWSLDLSNLSGANTLIFRVEAFGIYQEIQIPVLADDKTDIDLVFSFSTSSLAAAQLTANTWTNGSVSGNTYNTEVWYTINVTAGTTYYFWVNSANEGDGSKTAGTHINVFNSNGSSLSGTTYFNAWLTPMLYTADANGTIYIRVTVYNWSWDNININTYAIAYSTNSDWHDGFSSLTTIPLTADEWIEGSVPIDTYYSETLYSISATAGTTYYFWMNNAWEGDGSKTAWANISVYYAGSDVLGRTSDAWYFPISYTTNANGTIYIRVEANGDYYREDTYAIAYSTNSSWYNAIESTAIPLNADEWIEGSVPIYTDRTVVWYSINVTAETTYYFWMNNANGDGSKTAWWTNVRIYDIDTGDSWYINGTWDYPDSFTANTSGTVYIRVQAEGDWYGEDTYAIMYSTTDTRE